MALYQKSLESANSWSSLRIDRHDLEHLHKCMKVHICWDAELEGESISIQGALLGTENILKGFRGSTRA